MVFLIAESIKDRMPAFCIVFFAATGARRILIDPGRVNVNEIFFPMHRAQISDPFKMTKEEGEKLIKQKEKENLNQSYAGSC